ncbi:protein slg1 [Fusarium flagelliforme]|uniref:Protein slg1 n=1 Tax=Fusarium flagelliforme TaxID=2675880 RepID=A0A395M8H8_9HYPO|nr:protein slg1 [Fusarium flagelliforme]
MAVTKFGFLTLLTMGAAQVSGRRQIQTPAQSPVLNEMTSQGCFSALPSDAEPHGSGAFLASGACWDSCTKKNKNVSITSGSTCYCSDNYPAKSSLVDDSSCDWPCPGYAMEACGGLDPKAYSVFNTGFELAPDYDDGEADDGDASSSATEASSSAFATISTASVASTKITVPSTTETEEVSSATATLDETSPVLPVTASQIAPVVNEQTAAATPSASTSIVPENASPRLSNPIGNIVRMMMSLL